MAIGLALLLGIVFPQNFNRPYRSRSFGEFWRRWHMTLSRFLRDYLYIPLGGNRGGRLRTARNLMITMLLGGLWHGAAWGFVLWGGIHGTALVIEHQFRGREVGLPGLAQVVHHLPRRRAGVDRLPRGRAERGGRALLAADRLGRRPP